MILVLLLTANAGKLASDYEALLGALESQLEDCDADSHSRGHGTHKKCCLRTWPADPIEAEARGLMVVYPTPEAGEESTAFAQARGLYRLSDGQWAAVLHPGYQRLTLAEEGTLIRYDGAPQTTSVTHTQDNTVVRSYVGDCRAHGPWWWDGQSMEAVLERLAADGALPTDCPQIEGPFVSANGSGYRRTDGTVMTCPSDAVITAQTLQVAVQGDLSRLIPDKFTLPKAWGCAREGIPDGDFHVPRSGQSYTITGGLPTGTLQTTDGATVQWSTWTPVLGDGSPKPTPFSSQGVLMITDEQEQTTVDVRIAVTEDGLTLQGHGRYRGEQTGHFFDGARDGAWTGTNTPVYRTAIHPDGQWAYLYAAQPIGCSEAIRQMLLATRPVSSSAFTSQLSARVSAAQARIDRDEARMGRDGTQPDEQRFIGCARQTLSRLEAYGAELNHARQADRVPTGACRGWLDTTMSELVAVQEDVCADWTRSALGSGLFSSAQAYLEAQARYQGLACRCSRLDDAAAEAWLQEVGVRAVDAWP